MKKKAIAREKAEKAVDRREVRTSWRPACLTEAERDICTIRESKI